MPFGGNGFGVDALDRGSGLDHCDAVLDEPLEEEEEARKRAMER
jgi:hypothetical protein